MICSSENLTRFIVRPSFRPDSNRSWRKIRGSRHEFSIFGDGDEELLLKALFRFVGDFARAGIRFAKSLFWRPEDDPLVLDLNGDGFVSKGIGAVYWDNDEDGFGERSGWLSGEDGFLVHDADGDGNIIASELFGGPGLSGFTELSDWDTNLDNIVDANDIGFGDLQIWRDANENGITDAGELHALAAFDITAFSLNAQPTNLITANGTTIRAESFFARSDGTTGGLGELIFEIDPSDTQYLGDARVASFAPEGTAGLPINAFGYGITTDLAVAASNDLELAQLIESTAAGMTVPDLDVLRDQARGVLGAWARSHSDSLELGAALVGANGSLVDFAVYRPVSAPAVPSAASNVAQRFGSFGPDLFLAPREIERQSRFDLLPSVNELAAMLGRADAADVTDIFDRVSAAAAPSPVPFTQQVTVTPQMIEASPLPTRVFDPSSFYFSMYDWRRQNTWRGGIGELVDLGALAVPSSDVGRIADIRQHGEDTSAEPVAPDVAENVDPINPGILSDEFSHVPGEPRQLLDRSGYELWGDPEWIGSLPAPEGSNAATSPSLAALPVASSNLSDAQNEVTPPEPAPTAVIDPRETLADADVAIAPPAAAQEDHPRLDRAQHELWGGPLHVSFIPPSDDVENADPTVAAPISEAPHGSVDAEIARKLAMIRQDLSTFGATGVGEIERLRQLPAQAMDIFA